MVKINKTGENMQVSLVRNITPQVNFGSVKEPEKTQYIGQIMAEKLRANSTPKEPQPIRPEDCFSDNYELNPVVKKLIDNSKFLLQTQNGDEYVSIKDAIKTYITNDWGDIDIPMIYHACSTYNTVDKIIQKGFEPKYISRTMYGPGFYFTGSEGDARNYGTAIMTAELKGHCCVLDPKWYDAISSDSVTGKISNLTGSDYFQSKAILNEYVRKLMYEELGVDFAYCYGNQVVFNQASILNMQSQRYQ